MFKVNSNFLMLVSASLLFLLSSCETINQKFVEMEQKFDDVDQRIDKLENTTVASVNTQILSIQNSIPGIEQTIIDLTNYVTLLKNENVTEFSTTITNIEQYIVNLKSQLTEIRNYTQTIIRQQTVDNEAWLEITLNTFNLYQSLQSQMSMIKVEISNVTRIINDLNISVNQQIIDFNVSLTALISQTEASIMKWVNERFSAYYTIAEVNAHVHNLIVENNIEINNEINDLIVMIDEMDIEINNVYQTVLQEAIIYFEGSITEILLQKIEEATISLNVSIESINARILDIENTFVIIDNSINTINQQVTSINVSIEQMTILQEQITQYITILQEEGDTYNTQITLLQQIHSELSVRIQELNVYVQQIVNDIDISISETRNWVNVTFATIEQFNIINSAVINIQAIINVVQTNIETINQTIINVNANITKIQNNVNITVQDLDNSTHEWVNEKLANYLTVKDADARLAEIEATLKAALSEYYAYVDNLDKESLLKRIADMENQLGSIRMDLMSEVMKAAETAIVEYDGNISEVLSSLKTEILDIEAGLDSMKAAVANYLKSLEEDVLEYIDKVMYDFLIFKDEVYGSIQSIVHIPTYSDGSVAVSSGSCAIQFEVLPVSAAKEIAAKKLYDDMSFDIVNVQTKAGSSGSPTKNLPITGVSMDGDFLVVSVSFSALGDEFFMGKQGIMGRLKLDYGKMSKASEYFTLYPVK